MSLGSRLLLRSTTTSSTTGPRLLRHLASALPHFHRHQHHYHHRHHRHEFSTTAGLTSFETSGNDGRYEQDMSVVRIDRDGTMGKQTTSIKELLLSTEVHVSPLMVIVPMLLVPHFLVG